MGGASGQALRTLERSQVGSSVGLGPGRMLASSSPAHSRPWAPRNFTAAWAVASPSSLVTIFKTRDSFSAGQRPSDISSVACGLRDKGAGNCRSAQPSLAFPLVLLCSWGVGWALGPPVPLHSCSSMHPPSAFRSLSPPAPHKPGAASVLLPLPQRSPAAYGPCSGRPSESPGRGEAGCGSGPRWAPAGRAGRGSWAAGPQACPRRGPGSRRRRWRSLLREGEPRSVRGAPGGGRRARALSTAVSKPHPAWVPQPDEMPAPGPLA